MNPVLNNLADQVTKTQQVEASAVTLLNGIAKRIADAISVAIGNGATAQELAPVQNEVDALRQSATDLATAVTANTPAAGAAPKKP